MCADRRGAVKIGLAYFFKWKQLKCLNVNVKLENFVHRTHFLSVYVTVDTYDTLFSAFSVAICFYYYVCQSSNCLLSKHEKQWHLQKNDCAHSLMMMTMVQKQFLGFVIIHQSTTLQHSWMYVLFFFFCLLFVFNLFVFHNGLLCVCP